LIAVSDEEYLELCLVGGLILDSKDFPEICSIVKAGDFICASTKACWLKMQELFRDGGIDLGDLYVSLPGKIEKEWLVKATTDTAPFNLIGRARQISELSKKRRIKAKLTAIAAKADSKESKSDWVLEEVISAYNEETGEVDRDSSIGAVVGRFQDVQRANKAKGSVGMKTGFELLSRDHVVYQPGHLWVIGAWTSVGKSAFMIEAVNRFFVENETGKVAVFSTEMTEEQNVARILANRTGVNANVILSGQMLDNHRNNVDDQISWVVGRNLYIYDKLRNIDDIMAQCRKLKFSDGIDIVWIDFIQNVFRPASGDQYAMTAQIAKDIQALAHDLRCTVVCLSQLPNSAGKEDSGILEFKGAGEIAAACDVGVLMKRSKEDNSTILFDVRKNRHGKCGKYLLQFDNGWTRIIEREAVA